ncbi:MAG TPA: chloride channel protein, partial [Acidimicrobiales bacterium]
RLLHAPVPLFAAIGMVAVFAGASKTPLACTILAVELFGWAALGPVAIACVAAYACSSTKGIYATQRHGARAPRITDPQPVTEPGHLRDSAPPAFEDPIPDP